ncbi:acyltransferase domain-containing protein, partial [Streptomyces sp. NPDC000941]
HLLVLSARTPQALDAATDRLAHHLRTHQPDLTHAAHTLAQGRHTFPHRRIAHGTTPDHIATTLETRNPHHTTTHHTTHDNPHIIFILSGQGPQHPHMGQQLYEQHPTYKQAIDTCAEILQPHLNHDIRKILYPTNTTDTNTAQHLLQQTQWAQPALFTTEYALIQLWKHWGITPHTLIGHSLGELIAAHTAGIFTLPDALHLTAQRAQLMQQQPPGTMININAPRHHIEPTLPPQLTIAAHNTPNDCVISGPTHHIQQYKQTIKHKGWTTQTITTQHAFHHPLMNPAAQQLHTTLKNTPHHPPHTPIITNTTGTHLTPQQAQNPHHWAHQITTTVHYTQTITTATHNTPHPILLEIGPGNTFTTLARHTTHNTTPTLTSLPHPKDPRTPTQTITHTLGQLWQHGTTPNWNNHNPQTQHPQHIPLPTYPFQHQHHWLPHPTKTTTA